MFFIEKSERGRENWVFSRGGNSEAPEPQGSGERR